MINLSETYKDYMGTMIRRADEAQRRILDLEESGNVVKINFRRAVNG